MKINAKEALVLGFLKAILISEHFGRFCWRIFKVCIAALPVKNIVTDNVSIGTAECWPSMYL